MADVHPTVQDYANCLLATWVLANGDVGVQIDFIGNADRSVQVDGTFGAGGTVLIEGSNDAINYHVLDDPQGVALSLTAAGVHAITQATRKIRARVSAGDGSTALTVSMSLRRTNHHTF